MDTNAGRRRFCRRLAGGAIAGMAPGVLAALPPGEGAGEDLFAFIARTAGAFDASLYARLAGAANPYKEGDEIVGVSAPDEATRVRARELLARTRVGDVDGHPFFEDELQRAIRARDQRAQAAAARTAGWTLRELASFVLAAPEDDLRAILPGLGSDVIACVVRIMSDDELAAAGARIWNPLPGSRIGARGYLGARIQPNSPTDDVEDVVWQVFDAFSYAVGDVVIGTNPVSSEPASVARLERALREIVVAFGLQDVLPHCVLAHIDIQAQVEAEHPGTTGIWFQSLAGSTAANRTFDLTLDKMLAHAGRRSGRFGLYFETGQGADFTNGHGHGVDMVVHESRKYGFARLLRARVAEAQRASGREPAPWLHLNDVAGFIGPEVFRTKEQLVRCCLEDIVMGKLHGLTIGLDVCSTLHMDVSLDDLDWCLDRVACAGPAYLMALPTRNDPMLGYLTTAYQDHVRLRESFGLRVDDRMWAFFQKLGAVDANGRPGPAFGDPTRVFLEYQRRRGDLRPEAELLAEGQRRLAAVRARGVPIATGHGEKPWQHEPALAAEIRGLYDDAKKSIWAELPPRFASALPGAVALHTASKDRTDYILHPQTGEVLDAASLGTVRRLAAEAREADVQVVVSDGLNANALADEGHLTPYLEALGRAVASQGLKLAAGLLVVRSGRVRVGYRIGELLFASSPGASRVRTIVHLIGERPGSMHHTFSAYITAVPASKWAETSAGRRVDHEVTRVVSGIADTAVRPEAAAAETARILAGGTA